MATRAISAGPSRVHPARASAETTLRSAPIPWYLWCGVLAVTSAIIGGAWDVSWHRSIGRDSFWTAAHMAIYASGVLAAAVCGYLILSTTFARSVGRFGSSTNSAVHLFGFRAPLGAFVAAWGGITMLISAPFDNWWHAAYGLDVKIVSPPHVLLLLGTRGVSIGVLLLILAAMNRAAAAASPDDAAPADHDPSTHRFAGLQRMLLYMGGLLLSGQMFLIMEYTWDVELHQARAYAAMAIMVPLALALISQASRSRWAATYCAAFYTLFTIAQILIFPLFPAQPKLGPVYFPVTHLVPPKFPVLLIVAAIALDLLWQRTRSWRVWQIALVSGILFVAIVFAVEWPFASFLMTKASENRFFGTIYFDYNSRADGFDRMRQWYQPDSGLRLAAGLAWAALFASISTFIGLRFGRWMQRVER